MTDDVVRIPTGKKAVSGEWTRVKSPRANVLLAHGAGARRDHQSMETLADTLAGAGFSSFRFNFPYTEAKRKVPDQPKVLIQTWTDVWKWMASRSDSDGVPVLAGGRSMGGRMASMAASQFPDDFTPDGLVFFAYPLHAPGRTDRLRAEHLQGIRAPMLFLSGTRDSMAKHDLMDDEIEKLAPLAQVHWIEGADHGFHVLKRSGRTDEDVQAETAGVLAEWLKTRVGAS